MEVKHYQKLDTCKTFRQALKYIDMYAMPITFRYKNKRHYATTVGAIITSLVYMSLTVVIGQAI